MKFVAPIEIRKLRAEMEMKALSLNEVVRRARIKKKLSRASEVLNGKRVDPDLLDKLSKVIHETPEPTEAAA